MKGKHFYLGANTPGGFFSYYDNIIRREDAKRIYLIKGGPGSGKSSFMKKIANIMEENNLKTEYIHCSSDDSSLDAIVIKDIKTAFLDATAPHNSDPVYPGAVDEIINLGAFWDRDKITLKRQEIISTQKKISECYERAYRYLNAISQFYLDNRQISLKTYDRYLHNVFLDEIAFEELAELPLTDYIGKKRRLFASAITPDGFVNRLDTIFNGMKVYSLNGFTDDILIRISDMICERGIDVEMYFCPMNPDKKCEHLVVSDLNIAFTTCNEYHAYKGEHQIDFSPLCPLSSPYTCHYEYNLAVINDIFKKVIELFKTAKKYHDILESFYIENMDFDKVDALSLKYAKEILEKI